MKKILILGGAWSQVPAIIRAKEMGYYVVTCDYLPDNPGHKYSDEYVNVSTIEIEKVVDVAKTKNIQGVIAYASDPAAPTAAYICEKMNLSGSSYNTTKMLCEKDLFRIFQKKNGFCTPWFFAVKSIDEGLEYGLDIDFPCVVKPVDSSGSKGITVVHSQNEYKDAIEKAFQYTRCGRVIVEEYIHSPYAQIHGEGIVVNKKLQFTALGDQRFRKSVPIGTSLPSSLDSIKMQKVTEEVARFIECSGFEYGGLNIEVRLTENDDIYIIEIGPRTGGNYMPQLAELATGVCEMDIVLNLAMGQECCIRYSGIMQYCFQYIVGSKKRGYFKEIYIDEYIRKKVVKKYIHKKRGDVVDEYENSSGVVGVILLKFSNAHEMEKDIREIEQHIEVIVQEAEYEK